MDGVVVRTRWGRYSTISSSSTSTGLASIRIERTGGAIAGWGTCMFCAEGARWWTKHLQWGESIS